MGNLYRGKGGEDRTMRLNMGTTRKETEKTLCVYRYTDIEDEQIKYVGIVRKGKLSNRLQSHETDDEWCKNRGWFIEYFDCDTQSEAEAFEAHLIALYGTDKYYNVKKAGWGINKYLPDVEKWWKPAMNPTCADFETMRAFRKFKKAVAERNYEEAKRLFESFEITRG